MGIRSYGAVKHNMCQRFAQRVASHNTPTFIPVCQRQSPGNVGVRYPTPNEQIADTYCVSRLHMIPMGIRSYGTVKRNMRQRFAQRVASHHTPTFIPVCQRQSPGNVGVRYPTPNEQIADTYCV